MHQRFSRESLIRIVEQAMIYQCACPAQVCKALGQIRELNTYQHHCIEKEEENQAVHRRISASCEKIYAELEQCLEDVLKLEGWHMETLEMPPDLAKHRRADHE